MALVELKEIQDFCKDKRIALVGNSSSILGKRLGKQIDEHDIIIRMNHAVRFIDKYSLDTGKKTDIYDCEVSVINHVLSLCKEANAKFNMRLIRWGDPNTTANENILVHSVKKMYLGDHAVHRKLKQEHFSEDFKPSTGAAVLNFLINHIEFKNINLYGFDFFKTALRNRSNMNEFCSYLYKDHSVNLEMEFFKKMMIDETVKHIC